MKKFAICLSVFISIMLGIFVYCENTNAWLGTDGTGSGSSSVGGGGGGGSSVDSTGTSWMYYEYIGGSRFRGWSIEFVPSNRDFGGIMRRIDPECAQDGMGFWHFGRNQFATFYHDYYDAFWKFNDFEAVLLCSDGACWSNNRYSTREGGWGHMETYIWKEQFRGSWNYPYNSNINSGDIDHYIYSWDNNESKYYPIYRAIKVSPADGEVWDAYKYEAERQNQSVTPRGSYPDNLYAFCSPNGPVANGLKVDLVYHDKTVEEDVCTGEQNVKDSTWTESKTYSDKDDGEDGWVRNIDTLRDDKVAEGWNLDSQEPSDNSNGITWHDGDLVDAEVSEPRTVTIHLSKERKEMTGQGRDCDCVGWTPDEYKNSNIWQGETKVVIGVINHTLTGQNQNGEWHHETDAKNGLKQGPIYAKPTDDVQWKYCYYPGVERAALQDVTVNNEHHPHTLDAPLVTELDNQPFYQAYGEETWKGKFQVKSDNIKTSEEYARELAGIEYDGNDPGDDEIIVGTLPGGNYEEGDNAQFEGEADDRQYLVQPREQPTLNRDSEGKGQNYYSKRLDPGWTLWGHIKVTNGFTHVDRNQQEHNWQCQPYECGTAEHPQTCYRGGCVHDKTFYENHKDNHQEKDDARVIVPYNYKNKAHVEFTKDETAEPYIFAGEKVEVKTPNVTVGTRKNDETAPDLGETGYATQVEEGRARLVAFLMDSKDYEAEAFWNGTMYTEDEYDNKIDEGDDAVIWRNDDEVCGLNGNKNAFNAKFGVCKYLEWYPASTGFARLNENSNMTGATYDFIEEKHYEVGSEPSDSSDEYNIFDEAAGNYFCVSAAVYPFSVKSDTDTDKQGDHSWYITKPVCKKIAKRPTFQVWGGGIYSAGGIDTSVSIKNNVLDEAGIKDTQNYTNMSTSLDSLGWTATGGKDTLFGSWGELAVTVKGTANNIASGAATGYGGHASGHGQEYDQDVNKTKTFDKQHNDSDSGKFNGNIVGMGTAGGYWGSMNTLCPRSPLSISNLSCMNGIGGFDDSALNATLTSEKSTILQRFPASGSGNGYDFIDGQGSIGGYPSTSNKTVIVHNGGDINITGDIIYPQTKNLSTLQDVPKLYIYAEGSIKVNCDVTRIDAILIAAGGEFDSCSDGTTGDDLDSWNEDKKSHQLVVNGTVVANSLNLRRSYGISTGRYSMTPGELINYDSSIYLWANSEAEGVHSGSITEKASRELAPRY